MRVEKRTGQAEARIWLGRQPNSDVASIRLLVHLALEVVDFVYLGQRQVGEYAIASALSCRHAGPVKEGDLGSALDIDSHVGLVVRLEGPG